MPPYFQRPPGRQKIVQFIYQLDGRTSEDLIDLLNINENWKSLALAINCSQVQIQKFQNRMYQHGGSPAKAIFDFLSSKNTDVEKMFLLLHKIELYRGMDLLKEFVKKELHELIRQGPVLSPEMNKHTPVLPPTNSYRNPNKMSSGGLSGVVLDSDTRSMNLSTAMIQSPGDGPNNQYSPRLTNQPQQRYDQPQLLSMNKQQYDHIDQQQLYGLQQQQQRHQLQGYQQYVPNPSQLDQQQMQQNAQNYLQINAQLGQDQFQQYYNGGQTNIGGPGGMVINQKKSPQLRNNRSPISPSMMVGSELQAPAQQIIGTSPNQTNGTRSRYPSTCSTYKTFTSTQSNNSVSNLTRVTIEDLATATENWKPSNKLGSGGYGEVFRGIWHHQDVAIKRIRRDLTNRNSDKQLWTFSKEVEFLNSNKSEFILAIIAFCDNPDDPCIVTQFMRNGSLDDRLKCKSGSMPLRWRTRYNIAVGTANGLQFIHSKKTASGIRLVHGDIKPGNILLDQNMVPKIADFGLAREMSVDQSKIQVSQISGTQFYLPFEYIRERQLKTKVDTYSFGVVLFDLITGKPPNYKPDKSKPYLIDILRESVDNINDWVDKLMPVSHEENAENIVKILYEYGLRCTRDKAKDRPEMETVYINLNEPLKVWELQLHYDSIKSQQDSPRTLLQHGGGHVLAGNQLKVNNQDNVQTRNADGSPRIQRVCLDEPKVPGQDIGKVQKVGLKDVDLIRETGGPNGFNQGQPGSNMEQTGPYTGFDRGQPSAEHNPQHQRNIRLDLLNMSSMSGTNLPQPIPLERSPQPIKLERSHQSLTGTTAVPGLSVPSSSHVKIYNSYRIQSTDLQQMPTTLNSTSSNIINSRQVRNLTTDDVNIPATLDPSSSHIVSDYQSLPVTLNDHHSGAQKSTGSIQIPTVLTSSSQMGNSRNISQLSMQSGDLCPVPDFDDLMCSQSSVLNSNTSQSLVSGETDSSSTIDDSNRFSTIDDMASDMADINLDGW